MSLILRIDDRLIHGQVLVGWGSYYNIQELAVGNDDIAADEWEREMLSTVAGEIDTRVLTLAETLNYVHDHLDDNTTTMVLIESAEDMQKLAETGLKLRKINIGGIHYAEGRREYLPYLFLRKSEEEIFRKLIAEGYKFICQDVPTGAKYDLEKVLEKYND